MDRKYKLTPKNILYAFLIAAIPIVGVGGVSIYPVNIRFYVIIGIGAICIFLTLFLQKKLVLNSITVPSLFLCGIMLVSASYSVDQSTSIYFAVVYICSASLLYVNFPEKFFDRVLMVIKVFCIVIAISIILSVFIDDFIVKYCSFIVNPKNYALITQPIHSEINNSHAYSGLAKERAEAAFIMNVGIAICFSKYFSGIKMKKLDYAELFLFLAALIFTNKRTLFIIPIIAFAIMMLLGNVKSKVVKFILIVVIAVISFMVMSEFIPQIDNIYKRLFLSDSSDVLNGRGTLWKYSEDMFVRKPLFGYGFGAFNFYAYKHGLLINGEKWMYYGHNCYFELPAELGIFGTLIFAVAFLIPFAYTFCLIRKKSEYKNCNRLIMFSLYLQIMFLIYCFSGNVLYYPQQIMMWFFAIAITAFVKNKTGIKLYTNKHSSFINNKKTN